jgi:ribosomal protein L37AE/L43A
MAQDSSSKSCPKCGSSMIHRKASVGFPAHWVCTNCAHTTLAAPAVGNESAGKPGKQTLVD